MSLQVETNKNNTVSSVIDSTLAFLSKTNTDWEIISIASFLWNGDQLRKTLVRIRNNTDEQTRVIQAMNSGNAAAPVQINNAFARNAINQRYLRAAEEGLKRCYLTTITHGARVLRFSAVLLRLPPISRSVMDNSLELIAYSTTAYKFAATKNPAHIKRPHPVTYKDQVYRMAKTATAMMCVAGCVFELAKSYQYVEETNHAYQTATQLALASFISDVGDSALQYFGILAIRE